MPNDLLLPKLIAHRGASKVTPENTLIAFEKAHELGATWVEFDVMLTRDHVAIIHHDDTFARILGLAQNISDTAYDAIRARDAGSWFDKKFSFVRIPTLAQTLSRCAELGLCVNIELKTHAQHAQHTAEQTLELLSQFEFFTPKRVLISSQEPLALATVYAQTTEFNLGLIADHWADVDKALTHDFALYSLNLHHTMITPEKMTQAHAQGYDVLAFTVNDCILAERLFHLGVCSIFSDDPQLLNL